MFFALEGFRVSSCSQLLFSKRDATLRRPPLPLPPPLTLPFPSLFSPSWTPSITILQRLPRPPFLQPSLLLFLLAFLTLFFSLNLFSIFRACLGTMGTSARSRSKRAKPGSSTTTSAVVVEVRWPIKLATGMVLRWVWALWWMAPSAGCPESPSS